MTGDKKIYLMGISKRCDRVISSGMIDIKMVAGLFDNDSEKWGKEEYGLTIEQPRYIENTQIIVTTVERYHIAILGQLLELGFTSISLIQNQADGFKMKKMDFGRCVSEYGCRKLILLYLQHRSYSNLSAIEYMVQEGLVNTYGFAVKEFTQQEQDEKNEQYYYDLSMARYMITERDFPGLPTGSEGIKRIQLWHGFPLKCMGAMDAEFDCARRVDIQTGWNRYDYIASYGLNYTTFICACYGTIFRKFIETGMPRNDLLFCTDGRKNIESRFPNSIGKKVIFYMPTFREIAGRINGSCEGYLFYWPGFDIAAFERFCAEHDLYFIFKLHPSDSSRVKEWCKESDQFGILTDELLGSQSTYQFLNGADALLTDYSSVYFDYLLLNKPIIFTNRDEKEYIQNRGVILEPLSFWRPGPVVDNMSGLYRELEKISGNIDDYEEMRKMLLPFVHKHPDGNSTQRLFDFIGKNGG